MTAEGEILGVGSWLCFICCPLQGGSNLQPSREPTNPEYFLLNLNPKKLFCLDLGLGRPLALSVGQLPDEVTGLSTMDSICVGNVSLGIGSALSCDSIKKHKLPRCRHPPQPETLGWFRGGLLTERLEDLPSHSDVCVGFWWMWLNYISATTNPCSCGTG
ncbi:hypothetical protein JOB18_000436 [Solea senegalensis]|uniref:Uncharacterized protein n=1 Tax=Solea senegalensis TaxID=28829 RepID=A0AAV6QQW7_SOLSE|nr:hypothetical protein JOB18_000436 [Solea senegalensis]